jgi:chemotaxis protein MotB
MTRTKTQIPMYRLLFLGSFLGLLLATSCVSQQRYDEMAQVADYYKQQAAGADSISSYNTQLADEEGSLNKDFRDLTDKVERLTATNISLHRSYTELETRYNALVDQSSKVLSTSGSEVTDLQQSLADYEAELIRKEREIEALEYEIDECEAEIERLENGAVAEYNTTNARDRRMREAQSKLQFTSSQLSQISASLLQGLTGYGNTELTVQQREGKIYLTLTEFLLFPTGSTQLNQRGRQALRQAAIVLRQHPEISVLVLGHTDTDGGADYNWKLSTDRALAVAKDLIADGVNPAGITAAGRSFYDPIVPNTSPSNKALNRRTEIILTPNYDEILELIRE